MNLHASGDPMLRWLKALAARVMGRQPPFDHPLDDPYAGVRMPRPHGPSGRSSSVSVPEPDLHDETHAVGSSRAKRPSG